MARTGHEAVLVRHGETDWSLSGQHTGTTDIPLTDEGRRQAQLAGERLAGRKFALVLTSPLGRAQETFRLSGLGEQAQVREDLREWDYGAYEGMTTKDIRAQNPGWDLFRDGCPGGEDAAQVGARADRIVAELRAAGGDTAVFAHGHILRVLGARWLELAPAEARRFALSTATVSVLGFEHDWPAVWLWNDASHLGTGV
ncbi:MAG TPA: histidine phosphatase family protein [Solirubrobacteraceae bacterium]